MKLTIHLMKDTVKDFDGLLEDKYVGGSSAYNELVPRQTPPFPCRVYVQHKESLPRWSRYFEPFFSSDDLQDPNISHSLIALVKIKDRVFALTFGHGSYAIKRNLLEPRFGLKCTLNLADPFQINTLDTRNIDLVAQQRRIHVSAGRSFPEFEIDPLVDWVGYIAGRTDGRGLIRNVAGADSVSITTEASFAELGEICVKLLEAFYSDEYKEKYPFVDYLSPLPKDDPVIKTLDNQFYEAHHSHTYQLAVTAGYSHKETVLFILAINMVLSCLAVVIWKWPEHLLPVVLIAMGCLLAAYLTFQYRFTRITSSKPSINF